MSRFALTLDTLNLGDASAYGLHQQSQQQQQQQQQQTAGGIQSSAGSCASSVPSCSSYMTSLPSPSPNLLHKQESTDSLAGDTLRTSGGKRTANFFNASSPIIAPIAGPSTRRRTPSGLSVASNDSDVPIERVDEPLSRLPSKRRDPKADHHVQHDQLEQQHRRKRSTSNSRMPIPTTANRYPNLLPTPVPDHAPGSSSGSSPQTTPTSSSQTPFPTLPPAREEEAIPEQAPATATQAPPVGSPGSCIGDKYIIHSLLGTGAFSQVMLAHDKRFHAAVAVKLIPRHTIDANERMRLAVLRETEVLKHIRHPSLVRLVESFETPDYECLALEYVSGGEMFTLLAEKHQLFTDAFVRRVFSGLLDVVKWMHSINLVHRDIKLENTLLTIHPFPLTQSVDDLPNPLVKLTDFGLSRFIDPAAPTLRTRCGSEEYAAPELITARPYDGRKTDAWSLGIVLYALLTGAMPFMPGDPTFSPRSSTGSSNSRRSYLMRIAKAEYYWPIPESDDAVALPFQISDAAKGTVSKLLARDPAKRTTLEELWDTDEWLNRGGLGKIEARDWVARQEQIWVRDGRERSDVLTAEVDPL